MLQPAGETPEQHTCLRRSHVTRVSMAALCLQTSPLGPVPNHVEPVRGRGLTRDRVEPSKSFKVGTMFGSRASGARLTSQSPGGRSEPACSDTGSPGGDEEEKYHDITGQTHDKGFVLYTIVESLEEPKTT